MRFVVSEDARLPQLNSVWVPEGVDEAAARTRLLRNSAWRSVPASGLWLARCGGSA